MLFDSSLRKELARSFGATLIVLVTVVMTITLIRTLGQASRGSFNPSDVMLVMGYNVLTFLPNILTMGLFIAVVSTLSRGYADSEMVIWFSSGMGIASFLRPLVRFAWPILLGVAMLSLLVLPWANQQIEGLRTQYENRGDLDRIQPGQFQESADGTRLFFVEKSQPDQTTVTNVFVSTTGQGKETITAAHQGHSEIVDGDRYLVLENGQRLEYGLNSADIKLSEFSVYRLRVGQAPQGNALELPLNNRSTLDLLRDRSAASLGELSWRIGFVLAAFNLLVIALAATRVNPRVGRTGNLVFSMLLFQVYLNLLTLGQNWIATQSVGFVAFNLALHGGACVLALLWVAKVHFNWNWRSLLPRSGSLTSKPNA